MFKDFKRLSSTGEESPLMLKLGNKVRRMQWTFCHEQATESMVEKAVMLERDDFKDAFVGKIFKVVFWTLFWTLVACMLSLVAVVSW